MEAGGGGRHDHLAQPPLSHQVEIEMIIISSGQSTNVRRKVPFFGIYVVMFIDVSYTFLKVSVVVILFIVAFAFGFFVLFDNQPYFKTFWLSLVKTVIMTSGEMEYDNLFFDNEKYNDGVVMVPYPDTTRMLFLFFVLIMPIIIMNLLVGLAVDDIKTVQENAVLKRFV